MKKIIYGYSLIFNIYERGAVMKTKISKKNVFLFIGMTLLFCALSSYIVEEKEKVYVEPAPVVEEVEVEHVHRHHHHDVEVEIK